MSSPIFETFSLFFCAEFNLEQSLLAMWEVLKCDYWSYPDAALNRSQPIESVWVNQPLHVRDKERTCGTFFV